MKTWSWKLLAAIAVIFGVALPSAGAQDVIKIGATAPITGGLSSIYSIQGKLWDAWTQAQNEAGGIFVKSLNKKLPVKIIYYDDKSDPKVSVKFYERLISEDQVNFLMGPPGSPIAFAASTVAERYKFPMIHGAASDPQIFARDFKYIQGVLGPAPNWSRHFFDLLGKAGNVKTVALVVEDSLYSRGVALGVRSLAEKNGVKVIFDQTIPPDNQDFTAVTAQIKQANPDLVYVATFPPFYIRFAKQAAELGLKPKAMHCSTCSAVSVRDGLGSAAEGISGEVFWVPGMKLGDYKMLERSLQISGLDPVQWTFAVISISALEVIRGGIEKAGTLDREEVYKAIQTNDISTVLGTFKAVGNGIGTLDPLAMQVQSGKVQVIWPSEAKTADYKFPR